jgi:acyl-CoA thioesterase-1
MRAMAVGALAILMGSGMMNTAMARPVRILALGDSLTAGYLLPEKDAFPVVLERALRAAGHDVEVVNAGVSGDTASAALERLDWALDADTGAAIVEVGANDMLRGVDPAITKQAIASILEKLKARGVQAMLAGMVAAPGMGADYEHKFNAIFPDLARQFDAPLYPFFLDGVAGNASLGLSDGLHPNAAGVRLMVERILPTVEILLSRSRAKN